MNRKTEILKLTSVLFGVMFIVICIAGLFLFFLDNSRPGDPDSLGVGKAVKLVWQVIVVGAVIILGVPALCVSIITGIKAKRSEKALTQNETAGDSEPLPPDSEP